MPTKKNSMLFGWLFLFCLLLALVAAMGFRDPFWVTTPEIEVVVVDNETQKPLAGANVEITWSEITGGSFGGPGGRVFKLINATTDSFGKISIPPNSSLHFFSSFSSLACIVSYEGYIERGSGFFAKDNSGQLKIMDVRNTKFDGKIAYIGLEKKNVQ